MLITDLVTDLASKFASRAAEADLIGKLPSEDVAALQDSGYLAISIPKEFGGWGLSLRQCVEAQIQLAQGSGSTAFVAGMTIQIFGYAREMANWSPENYSRLASFVTQGGLVNSIASEPLMGSPSRGGLPHTNLTPSAVKDSWLLNGHKTWSSGGKHLTHMLVRASIGESEWAVALVHQNTPGIHWEETWSDSLSLRASDSHDVFFNDVPIPETDIIERGTTKRPPNPWFAMMLAAVYLGIAMAARNALIKYSLERIPTTLGKPIATLPNIQAEIGSIDMTLIAANNYLLDVADKWTGQPQDITAYYPKIAAAKHLAVDTAVKVTEAALKTAGGASLTKALPLERHFRDVRAGLMQPPAADTAMQLLGNLAINNYTAKF
ncbi:MAG: acyl-CoA/acyl-ACP dehydrogenase [Anaerolineae bacterium]|nr:acyl-CoA/acyl-ACP dehydrogenase [Anaerolineae bacterium]